MAMFNQRKVISAHIIALIALSVLLSGCTPPVARRVGSGRTAQIPAGTPTEIQDTPPTLTFIAKPVTIYPSGQCPFISPQDVVSTVKSDVNKEVPLHARSLLLCRYYDQDALNQAELLNDSRTLISDSKRIDEFATLINGLPKGKQCNRSQRASTLVAAFGYGSGQVRDVNIILSGCESYQSNSQPPLDASGRQSRRLVALLNYVTPYPGHLLLHPLDRCPLQPPEGIRSTGDGLSGAFVPGDPIKAKLCRYYSPGFGPKDPPYHLVDSLLITNRSEVGHLRDLMNPFPQASKRVAPSCPAGTHYDSIIAAFGYADSRVVDVDIDLTTCTSISNGKRFAVVIYYPGDNGLKLLKELNRMIPVPGRPHIEERYFKGT